MATPRETPESEPVPTLSEHSFDSSQSALEAYDQWHLTYHTFHIT